MNNHCENKKASDGLRALFIIVGAVVTIGGIIALLYGLFKKYFKITFETGSDDCDCFGEDCTCEPVCCCSCDDETDEENEEL